MATHPHKPMDYYTEFAAQLEEIRRHKWIESQLLGEDIGFEKALTEWMTRHGETWRKEYREGR